MSFSATSALSARDNAVYVEALNLRENTSALADTRKRNSAGDECAFLHACCNIVSLLDAVAHSDAVSKIASDDESWICLLQQGNAF